MTNDEPKTKEMILCDALNLAKYAKSYSREFVNELERKSPDELETSDMRLIAESLSQICEKYRNLIVKIHETNE